MVSTDLIERSRLEIQKNLDAAKVQEDRRKLGQFATPSYLAMEMLQYAHTVLGQGEIRFLDPAFGTGVFYSALLSVFPIDRIKTAVGFEIDKAYWRAAMNLWNHGPPLDLQLADFTCTSPPKSQREKFNLIICNPPYVRHHVMEVSEKQRLVDLVSKSVGIRPSGYSGLYCYFLMLSHNWMSTNGLAGWLIPSEFMDVNYGRQVKRYLLSQVTLLRIHRFNPSEVQFNDALVSSAIVWLKNSIPSSSHSVEFSYGGTLLKPSVSKHVSIEILKDLPKWSRLPLVSYVQLLSGVTAKLGDFFTIKRGIATGANDFFVLTQEKAEELQIPAECLKPVLPPPRFLYIDKVEADEKGKPLLNQNFVLLACDLPEETIRKNYSAFWSYLEQGKEQKINDRYICAHRSPWYSQENRPPAPFIFNIMGRPGNTKRKPYRFVFNKSQATATNVYLMLYPKPSLQELLNRDPNLLEEIWTVLNRIPLDNLLKEGRVYGGGLYKIEPKELRRVSSDELLHLILRHQEVEPRTKTLESYQD
jgi:adenine-specific DNA-methyltransferase